MWGQQRLEQQQQQHRLEQQAAGNIRIWHTMWHILNFYYTRTLALMQWHFYYRPKRRRGLFTAPTVAKQQSQPSTPTSPWHPRLPESHTQYPHLVAGTPKKCPVQRMVSIFIMCSDPEPRHAPPTLSPISSFAIPPSVLQHSVHFFLWQITKQFIWGMLIHRWDLPQRERDKATKHIW